MGLPAAMPQVHPVPPPLAPKEPGTVAHRDCGVQRALVTVATEINPCGICFHRPGEHGLHWNIDNVVAQEHKAEGGFGRPGLGTWFMRQRPPCDSPRVPKPHGR